MPLQLNLEMFIYNNYANIYYLSVYQWKYGPPTKCYGNPVLEKLWNMKMKGRFSDSDTEFLESQLQSRACYRNHVLQYKRSYYRCKNGAQGIVPLEYNIVNNVNYSLLNG